MNRYSGLSCVWIAVSLVSCGSQTDFKEPQPAKSPVLQQIPVRLQGRYLATDSESVLTIYPNAMVRIYDFDVKCGRDKLPAGYTLIGDTLTIYDYDGYSETQIVDRLNDSTIVYHEHMLDTLFAVNPASVLKEDKGYYFLNEHIQTDSAKFVWEVRAMGLQNGLLTVAYVDNASDIGRLSQISTSASDTLPIKKKPVHRKYKELDEEDSMEKVDSFFRTNL